MHGVLGFSQPTHPHACLFKGPAHEPLALATDLLCCPLQANILTIEAQGPKIQ